MRVWGKMISGRDFHPKQTQPKIVDYCQPGCEGTIDLSKQAFSAIAYLSAGRVKIEYTQ